MKMPTESGILCVQIVGRIIGEELNLAHISVHQTLTNELGHKEGRCLDFLDWIENNLHFLESVTGDESWVFE